MMKRAIIAVSCVFLFCLSGRCQESAGLHWGDLGNGWFANPVVNADYSDPDVIRVGDKFYMTCSEFHYMGMKILESEDMVNWKIISTVFERLEGYDGMDKYGQGTWAPTLRWHDGLFYIFVCTPGEGLFMTTAERAEGPWAPMHLVKGVAGWEDPCPFWDDDGKAYLGHSRLGAGPIIIHRMSPDGRSLLDEGREVHSGLVAEGTKIMKKDGWYWLMIPEGGWSDGWQMAYRSKSIYGPYEGRRILEQGSTDINGPNQGALVDTPSGDWWFYYFQLSRVLGRVLHLQPVYWPEGGFPMAGFDCDGNGVGEPMRVVRKPAVNPRKVSDYSIATDDSFDGPQLGIQWQFNHNPADGNWSLSERPGWLTLIPMAADSLRFARNQLTQKIMGYSGKACVKIDFSQMVEGQKAGVECIGKWFFCGGVMISGKKPYIFYEHNGQTDKVCALPDGIREIWVSLDLDDPSTDNKIMTNSQQFSYSVDGEDFTPFGEAFSNIWKDWKGIRLGIFSYSSAPASRREAVRRKKNPGRAFFDDFTYKVK